MNTLYITAACFQPLDESLVARYGYIVRDNYATEFNDDFADKEALKRFFPHPLRWYEVRLTARSSIHLPKSSSCTITAG